LQMGRRFTLIRYVYGLATLAFALAVWGIPTAAMPTWTGAAVVLIVFGLVNPWQKLRDDELGQLHSEYLPVRARDEALGRSMAILREILPVSLAVALVGVITSVSSEAALSFWVDRPLVWFLSGPALAGAMAAASSFGVVARALAPLMALVFVVAAASLPGWVAAAAYMTVAILGHASAFWALGEAPFQARGNR